MYQRSRKRFWHWNAGAAPRNPWKRPLRISAAARRLKCRSQRIGYMKHSKKQIKLLG